jgi:hypothetical protein
LMRIQLWSMMWEDAASICLCDFRLGDKTIIEWQPMQLSWSTEFGGWTELSARSWRVRWRARLRQRGCQMFLKFMGIGMIGVPFGFVYFSKSQIWIWNTKSVAFWGRRKLCWTHKVSGHALETRTGFAKQIVSTSHSRVGLRFAAKWGDIPRIIFTHFRRLLKVAIIQGLRVVFLRLTLRVASFIEPVLRVVTFVWPFRWPGWHAASVR